MKPLLRTVLKGVSLTAALFVFQACYGTPVAAPPEEEGLAMEAVDDTPAGEEVPDAGGPAAEQPQQ